MTPARRARPVSPRVAVAGAKARVFRGLATVLTTVLVRRLTTTGTGRRARQCRSASSKPLAATAPRNPTAGGAMGNALMERMPARTMKSARQAMGTGTGDHAQAPLGALSTTNAAPAPLTTTAGGATVPVWLAPRRVLTTANAPQVVATGTGTRAARIAAHCTPATHARTRQAVAGVPPAASALLETRTAPPPTRAAVPMTTTTAPGSTTLARTALCTRTARRARTKAAADGAKIPGRACSDSLVEAQTPRARAVIGRGSAPHAAATTTTARTAQTT